MAVVFNIVFKSIIIIFALATQLHAEETAGTGRFMDKVYQHNLIMGQHAPLPARIEVILPQDLYLQSVRALLVIDGQLIAHDLKFDSATHSFQGEFPTPREELRYQFQLIDTYGTSVVSQLYRAAPPCNSFRLEKLKGKDYTSNQQRELIIDSIELKVENDTLQHTIADLEGILNERQAPKTPMLEAEVQSES